MPKIMEPERYTKVEQVKKPVPGHYYFNGDGIRHINFAPGWYYYFRSATKIGPYPSERAALTAGCEATAKRRSTS